MRVISDGALLPTPFVSVPVNASGERGLLGIAFDPDFLTNQFVYVYYTTSTSPVHNRISRFTADGADGKLYAGVGENASPPNPQSLTKRTGSIRRCHASPP